MIRTLLCLGLVISACRTDQQLSGTSIGNPNRTMVDVAATPGLSIEEISAEQARLVLLGCDGIQISLSLPEDTLLGHTLAIPEDRDWCWMSLELDAPLLLVGFREEAATEVVLALDVESVPLQLTPSVSLEGPHIFELGAPDWASELIALPEEEEPLFIDEEHPLHNTLVSRLREDAALWPDLNNDGFVGEEERAVVPAASFSNDAPAFADEDDEDGEDEDEATVGTSGCGCTSIGMTGLAPWSSLLWLWCLRRRRRPHD